MNSKRIIALVLVVVFAVLSVMGSPRTASAQTSAGTQFWLPTIRNVTITGSPLLRSKSTQRGDNLGVIVPNSFGEILASEKNPEGTWDLLRWESKDTSKFGFGWARENILGLVDNTDGSWQIPTCQLKDKGIKVDIPVMIDGKYGFDIPSHPCNLLVDGRSGTEQEHEIWILRSNASEPSERDLPNTNGVLIVSEATGWEYPMNWNMQDFSDTVNEPIAGMFVAGARRDMKAADPAYEWPINVFTTDGSKMTWAVGAQVPSEDKGDRSPTDQPERIAVQGIANGDTFSASIGTDGVIVVALVNAHLYQWTGIEKFTFTKVEAYFIPKTWDQDKINAWAKNKWPNKTIEFSPFNSGTATPEPTAAATAAATATKP